VEEEDKSTTFFSVTRKSTNFVDFVDFFAQTII